MPVARGQCPKPTARAKAVEAKAKAKAKAKAMAKAAAEGVASGAAEGTSAVGCAIAAEGTANGKEAAKSKAAAKCKAAAKGKAAAKAAAATCELSAGSNPDAMPKMEVSEEVSGGTAKAAKTTTVHTAATGTAVWSGELGTTQDERSVRKRPSAKLAAPLHPRNHWKSHCVLVLQSPLPCFHL